MSKAWDNYQEAQRAEDEAWDNYTMNVHAMNVELPATVQEAFSAWVMAKRATQKAWATYQRSEGAQQ